MSDSQQQAPEEFKGRLAPGRSWTEIVAWVGDLPPLPQVASKAISLVEDPDTTAGQLTDLLSSDPALAARVLKIANSAMFSRQREITTLNQAIMVIGFKALKGIIVAATLRQLNRKHGDIEQLVWKNSMCTAMASNLIAKRLRKPYVDECFLLGLLHDLGKLVLIRQTSEEYKEIVKSVKGGETFFEAENRILGFAHPLIGALVAKKWNFSPEICQVILHHHDPIDLPAEGPLDEKTLIVQVSNWIAHKLGHGHIEGYPEMEEEHKALAAALTFDDEAVEEILAEVQETFEAQSSVFG
jgi:HD-like signal output (HDOD) protein